jgi:predicted nucleotidyltransferase
MTRTPAVRNHPGLSHLALHEWDALTDPLTWLQPRCGDRVVHAWIFGSKARGDFDDESDVDLLIVIRDADDALREEVSNVAYDLSLEHSVLLCEHVISAWRFAQMRARREPLYSNIVREGIDLWAVEPLRTSTE